jgi:uncharacterized membrane protein YcaP (DUF421 family)
MDMLVTLLDPVLGLHVEPRDLAMLRIAHKRFFAHRNALDVLLSLVLASTLARAINGNAAFFESIGAGFALVLTHRAVAWVAARSPRIERLVKGRPTLLVTGGAIQHATLRRHDLSEDDLVEDLRLSGHGSFASVREARLERNGKISILHPTRREDAGAR